MFGLWGCGLMRYDAMGCHIYSSAEPQTRSSAMILSSNRESFRRLAYDRSMRGVHGNSDESCELHIVTGNIRRAQARLQAAASRLAAGHGMVDPD